MNKSYNKIKKNISNTYNYYILSKINNKYENILPRKKQKKSGELMQKEDITDFYFEKNLDEELEEEVIDELFWEYSPDDKNIINASSFDYSFKYTFEEKNAKEKEESKSEYYENNIFKNIKKLIKYSNIIIYTLYYYKLNKLNEVCIDKLNKLLRITKTMSDFDNFNEKNGNKIIEIYEKVKNINDIDAIYEYILYISKYLNYINRILYKNNYSCLYEKHYDIKICSDLLKLNKLLDNYNLYEIFRRYIFFIKQINKNKNYIAENQKYIENIESYINYFIIYYGNILRKDINIYLCQNNKINEINNKTILQIFTNICIFFNKEINKIYYDE